MNSKSEFVNTGIIAPIKNVSSCLALAKQLQNRPLGLDKNIGVFCGHTGMGKSIAALFTQNVVGAAYVEITDTWTRKKLLMSILSEFNKPHAKGTLSDLEDQVIAVMARNPTKPLIIDEADKLVDRKMIEMMRMIIKASNGCCLLIGEDLLAEKINHIPNVQGLVVDTVYAQECDFDDTRKLAKSLYPDIVIDDELIETARKQAGGRARLIGNSLHQIVATAKRLGVARIGMNDFIDHSGRFSSKSLPSREEAA